VRLLDAPLVLASPDRIPFAWIAALAASAEPDCAGRGKTRLPLAAPAGDVFRSSVKSDRKERPMCRNIRTLFNFEPPATEDEIRASALQFVRKLSGFNAPSKANEAAFHAAIEEVHAAAARLLDALETNAPPRDRDVEAAKAKARAAVRFGKAEA